MLRIISLLLAMVLIMANGKIEYTPYPTRSLYMAGTNYLLLSEADNLISVNPGAEMGDMTGWTGGATNINTDQFTGTRCFELGNALSMTTNQPFDLIRNQKYKIYFAGKKIGVTNSVNVYLLDENGISVLTETVLFTFGMPGWNEYHYSFQPTQNYYNCQLMMTAHGTDVIHLDDLSVIPEYLDMGLEDFSVDFLFQPLTQTGNRNIAGKLNWATVNRGWVLLYNWTDYKYYFGIGNGTTYVSGAFATAVSQIQNQEYHWGRLVVDRSANATMYVNGVSVGTLDISTVTGNISVPDELRLFGWDSTTNLAKGWCDFIRFQRGTIRTAAWMAEEWARIQAGRIRKISSATTMWDFDDNLVDECQGLILEENTGTITYADGWPYCVSPITYNFAVNYRYEHRLSPLASDSIVRAFRTGKAFNTPGARKDSWELVFVGISKAQYSAFNAAYEGGEVVDLWLDSANEQTAQVLFSEPPEQEGIPYFRSGEQAVNTTLRLVES